MNIISRGINNRLKSSTAVFSIIRLGGVSTPPSAPVIALAGSIDAQPIVGQASSTIEPTVTGATSTTYQWYRGAPTTTPIGGATSIGYTPVDADYSLTLYRRATYTNATGSTVEDIPAPSATGKQFSETFGAMTSGDNTATFLAYGWTRSNTGIEALVATETEGPSTKSVTWWGTPASFRNIYRTDWDTFSNTNSADDYEELFLYKHQTAAARMSLRPHNGVGTVGTSAGAGFVIRLNNVYAQLPGDDPNEAHGTFLRTLTVGNYYWFRKRSSGTTAQFKCWGSTVSEPSAFDTSRTYGSALTNRGPSFGYRAGTASDIQRMLYISSGHRAPAPYPADFELPLPSSADLMTYAAESSASSFTTNSLITWSF